MLAVSESPSARGISGREDAWQGDTAASARPGEEPPGPAIPEHPPSPAPCVYHRKEFLLVRRLLQLFYFFPTNPPAQLRGTFPPPSNSPGGSICFCLPLIACYFSLPAPPPFKDKF